MNLKIATTLFKFILVANCLESSFSSIDFIFEGTFVENHNVNTSLYKHVLCHPANNKNVFFIFVSILSLSNLRILYILFQLSHCNFFFIGK